MLRPVKVGTDAICGQPGDHGERRSDRMEKSETGLVEFRFVEITTAVAERHAKIGEMTSRQPEGPAGRVRDRALHTLPRYENLDGSVRVEKRANCAPVAWGQRRTR